MAKDIKSIIGEYKGEDVHPYGRKELYLADGNEKYLRQVVRQAFDSERRKAPDGDLLEVYNLYTLDGKRYVEVDGNLSEFARVMRRVDYRLRNNKWIEKIHLNIKEVLVFNEHGFVDHKEYYYV